MGRFISEDPIKDGVNWYSYCAGNPVMFSDPTGSKRVPVREYVEGNGGWVSYYEDDGKGKGPRVDITMKNQITLERETVSYYYLTNENGKTYIDSGALAAQFEMNDKIFLQKAYWNQGIADMYEYGLDEERIQNEIDNAMIGSSIQIKGIKIADSAIKGIVKKWGKKGIEIFTRAAGKGMVGAKNQSGIKVLTGTIKKGSTVYTHEIKVFNKGFADTRIYGYMNESGEFVFDYFKSGTH